MAKNEIEAIVVDPFRTPKGKTKKGQKVVLNYLDYNYLKGAGKIKDVSAEAEEVEKKETVFSKKK